MSGKRFRFSLERVLELRRRETEEARQTLAQVQRACRAQERHVAEARLRQATLQEQAPVLAAASVRGLRRYAAHGQDQRRAYRTACAKLEALREQESAAQRRLMEARRTEEGLDTLREQEKARHEKACAEAEAAFLDEQAVMRHRRTRRPSLL